MTNPPNIWNNGAPRYTLWTPPCVQNNPFRNLDAPLIAAAVVVVHPAAKA